MGHDYAFSYNIKLGNLVNKKVYEAIESSRTTCVPSKKLVQINFEICIDILSFHKISYK